MSSISSMASYQVSNIKNWFVSTSSQDKEKVNDNSQTSTENSGLAALMNQLGQRPATPPEQMEGSSQDYSGTSNLSSDTMRGLFQSTQATDAENMVTAMDTDGDGTITQEEFVAARPDAVTEEMATNLWIQFDTESTGSLSTEELQTAMAEGMQGPPPPPPPPSSTEETTEDTESFVSSMDTDGDGIVTKEEFLAARPEDVSEEMAENLWDNFDTEGAGSLSTNELQTAMADNAPSQEQQMASAVSSGEQTGLNPEQYRRFFEAIQSYDLSAGYGNLQNLTSSLQALA